MVPFNGKLTYYWKRQGNPMTRPWIETIQCCNSLLTPPRIQTTGGKINKTMHIMIWLIWQYRANKLPCRHSKTPFWTAVARLKLLDYWQSCYTEQLMSILHSGNWFLDMKYTCVSRGQNKSTWETYYRFRFW